jgi:hypothetical protein
MWRCRFVDDNWWLRFCGFRAAFRGHFVAWSAGHCIGMALGLERTLESWVALAFVIYQLI